MRVTNNAKLLFQTTIIMLEISVLGMSCSRKPRVDSAAKANLSYKSDYAAWQANNKANEQWILIERSGVIKGAPQLLFNTVHHLPSIDACIYELAAIFIDPNYKPLTIEELEIAGIPTCVDMPYGRERGPMVIAYRYKDKLTMTGYANNIQLLNYNINQYCISKDCVFGWHQCFLESLYFYDEMGRECDYWFCPRPYM
jgi:hypothetical protein